MSDKEKIKAILGIINNGSQTFLEEDGTVYYWKINKEYSQYLMKVFESNTPQELIHKMSTMVQDNAEFFKIYGIAGYWNDLEYKDYWIMISKD